VYDYQAWFIIKEIKLEISVNPTPSQHWLYIPENVPEYTPRPSFCILSMTAPVVEASAGMFCIKQAKLH
jgi:hypothetical protein